MRINSLIQTSASSRRVRMSSMLGTPLAVAATLAILYTLWLLTFKFAGTDPRDFIFVGTRFVLHGHGSALITLDPRYAYQANGVGYDGQFAYYIALDPAHAAPYLDVPAYRYERVLYPLVARLLALGRPDAIPYTLIAVNYLALIGGVLAVGCWLRKKGINPWWAVLYGLYPGLLLSVRRDLTEPLAYALVALAVYLFDFGGSHRVVWSAIAFAAAVLTRESVAVVPAIYGMSLLFGTSGAMSGIARLRANARGTLLFMAIAFLPFGLYVLFLLRWLGAAGAPSTVLPQLIPFYGIVSLWPWSADQIIQVESVIVPAVICIGVGFVTLWHSVWSREVLVLLASALLFVVLLPPDSYLNIIASGRIATGVVLAALFCLPSCSSVFGGNRSWLLVSGMLWLTITPLLLWEPFGMLSP